ncbi:hypothetical protein DFH07DRAFT_969376 [Mycena maculata]|uniref:Integrase catalytic domain-containing protein n=1 Tax=Mycena maculata TaxID=230809 RepID=A0AAD7MSC7_9AGAR|nr:hypothetical protein DFH07DRAFT_969376 [Mycena maculata]
MANNTVGHNGVDNGERPSDDVLRESLLRYARLKLTIPQKISNLAEEHHYHIKSTKLKALNKEFNIPTVRKPAPISVIVCDKLDDDVNQGNGPDAMKTFLALDGYQIPRDTIRQVMKDNAPGSSKMRYPGNKEKIVRKNLTAQGVYQELHCDGHEKLGSAALRMGPVGISVYGFREKAGGLVAHLVAVPDARQSVVIGHVYLDCVESTGVIPIQITVDKGSETGEMFAAQAALREIYTPDLDTVQWPVVVALKSINNIPIENLWKWLLKTTGRNLRDIIEDDSHLRSFLSHHLNQINVFYSHLFHWLWSKIVQLKLDEFKLYWNYHTPRKNPKKALISGVAPIEIYRDPAKYGLARLSTPVEQESIDALRGNLEYTREEALQWVPDNFDVAATEAYQYIGSPALEPRRGWAIFAQMAPLLADLDI